MSTTMPQPQIPPRPQRAQKSGATLGSEMPQVPKRPIRIDRDRSPERYARSPLNEAPHSGTHGKSSLYSSEAANASASDLAGRPPSVNLPSIGQEGAEYGDVFLPEELGTSPTQTRNIANDLKLHAPKPSLPVSSAKQRVSTVTRTDSGQAAAFGIGKSAGDDKDPASRDLKSKASFASQTSGSTERRPSSVSESEHGIPEIGQRVPLFSNAGDVQAPSPSPYSQPFAPGVGFHNDGSKPRHHGRRTSARGHDIPPDAYGRYGHGAIPHDRFEKAYYEKHPELVKKELGQYGEGRPEWALSSEDLNKIVRDTGSRGVGLGTSSAVISTPTEQIGFQASEEYASRISSPRPQSSYNLAHSNTSGTHVDSPLSKEALSTDAAGKAEFESTLSRSLNAPSDISLSSEVEDDNVIHVEAPGRRHSKIYGGEKSMESRESLGMYEETGGEDEHAGDYGAPILAADEVAKEPFGWELQPAVSPMHERRSHEDTSYHQRNGSGSSLHGSRTSSRPGSIHGNVPGLKLPTPMEDVEEYEPLFPEDGKHDATMERPLTAADKLKRPDFKNRKFPSQDVWEDTPNSLQYTATVSTPQLPEEPEESRAGPTTETAAQEFARRQEELAEKESRNADSFLNREKKSWSHKSQLVAETRPGMKQRFPSRDIWEDTPDSLQLETTVAAPQSDDKDILSPESAADSASFHQEIAAATKPQIPARPTKSKLSESPEKAQPIIPERPSQRIRQLDGADGSPPMPTKAKPQIPARPVKLAHRDSSENVPLAPVTSNSSAKSIGSDGGSSAVAALKPKPPVPTRPLGSKIAALQGGFMSDLNKRLQLGPQAPKKDEPVPEEKEEEKEKAPLTDARKGRARGPARRAPAKSPAPATSGAASEVSPTLVFSIPSTVWEINPEEDILHVQGKSESVPSVSPKAIESSTPTLATNTAGEPVQEPLEIAEGAEKASSLPSAVEDAQAKEVEAEKKDQLVVDAASGNHEVQPVKASEEPPIEPESTLKVPEEEEEEDLSASTATLKPLQAKE